MDEDAKEAELIGWKDFLEDRSEPDHVEVLLLLGEVERARRVLEHLEWRGRQALPRTWIDATLPRARALLLAAEEERGGRSGGDRGRASGCDASIRACSAPAHQGTAGVA